MPRKGKKSTQPTKAKRSKPTATPRGAAQWPEGALARRQVLKGVVASGGVVASAMTLPKEWTKPVVQSIVASAHAQVSPPMAFPTPVPIASPVAPIPMSPMLPPPLFVPIPIGPAPEPMVPVPMSPVSPLFVPIPIGPF